MTKRESLAAERRRIAECDRRAAADFEAMRRTNAKPMPADLFRTKPADNAGGSSGFRVDGTSQWGSR